MSTIRISCQHRYNKPDQTYHFTVAVEVPGAPEPSLTSTVVSRFELTQMKAFKGSHQKRAAQFAQALINEKEVVLKTALRQRMAQIFRDKETN